MPRVGAAPDTLDMFKMSTPLRLSSRPRVVVVGEQRHPLGLTADDVEFGADVARIDATHPARQMLRVASRASRLIREEGFEAVHLQDARFAPAAFWLRRRHGIAVSAALGPPDVQRHLGVPGAGLRSLVRLDEAFVSDPEVIAALRLRAAAVPVTQISPVAVPLPAPGDRALTAATRALGELPPGRVVVALLWPAKTDRVRWYRDAIAPLLLGNPLTLILGAPSKGAFRSLTAAVRRRSAFAAHDGHVDAGLLAAVARCADVFVTIGEPARRFGASEEILALAASRVPLVASGADSIVLEHERNAFVTPAGDGFALVSTLNKMLALPAIQRHELGIDFAAHTLERHGLDASAANAAIYAQRFAALVGRPQIPEGLRAA